MSDTVPSSSFEDLHSSFPVTSSATPPSSPSRHNSEVAIEPEGAKSQRVTLKWWDLNYGVMVRNGKVKEQRLLLSAVHGVAEPAKVLAIMGGSGAGKTTLLDALAGRLQGAVEGHFTVNGVDVPLGYFGGHSKAYVFQGDTLHSMLSVKETLLFAARFQLGGKSPEEIQKTVDRWLDLLGLRHIESVLVGGEDRKGISGGQKRRLSLGIDMLKDPTVVFLDEPISGLDSTSAFKVVKAIKKVTLVNTCTVLLTIHQPSPRIMELLDSVLVMSDGRVIFQGQQSQVTEYLEACGQGTVPDYISPIEYFLDCVDELQEQGIGVQALAEYHAERSAADLWPAPSELGEPPQPRKSHWQDFVTLIHRTGLIVCRTPDLFVGRIIFYAIAGFLISTIFWQVGRTFQDVIEIAGFFIMSMSTLTFGSLEVLPFFALERDVIQRECFQGAYGISNYILAQSVVWTVSFIPISLFWTLATQWSVGLSTDINQVETFMFSWLNWFCAVFSANAFSMFLSAIFSPMLGTSFGTTFFDFMMMLSGFFVQRNNIPVYWIWFHYLSHFMYSQSAMLNNYFGNMPDTKFGCAAPYANDPSCALSGEQVLEYYDVSRWNKWASVGALIGFGILWRVLHCVVLTVRFRKLKPGKRQTRCKWLKQVVEDLRPTPALQPAISSALLRPLAP